MTLCVCQSECSSALGPRSCGELAARGAGCQGLPLPGGTCGPWTTCQPWRPRCWHPASDASSFKFLERWPLAQLRRCGFRGADHRGWWLLCGLDSNSDFREGRSEPGMLKPVLALADSVPPLSQAPSLPPGPACSEATAGLEKVGPVAPGGGRVLAGHWLNTRCQVWNACLLTPLGRSRVENGGADGWGGVASTPGSSRVCYPPSVRFYSGLSTVTQSTVFTGIEQWPEPL